VFASVARRLLPPVLAGVLLVAWLQPALIVPRCVTEPRVCDAGTLPLWDRWSIERHEAWAARLDEGLQWSVTGLAVALPVALRALPGAGTAGLVADWLLLAETAAWNWATTEAAQLLVQRPRPPLFNRRVNTKPLDRRSQYTSFWSGHTSYVAAMGFALASLAGIRGRGRTMWLLAALGLLATFATGAFRILEGRHFLFDVLAGALAGAMVAHIVLRLRAGDARWPDA